MCAQNVVRGKIDLRQADSNELSPIIMYLMRLEDRSQGLYI